MRNSRINDGNFSTVKLANTELSKLKSAAKYKTGTTLRMTKKNVQVEELPHELFLTKRQKNEIETPSLRICQSI